MVLLSNLQSRLDYDFIIGSVCLTNKRYREYFSTSYNRFTILDNGAFEGEALDSKSLLTLADATHATEIVAPDTIGDGQRTRNQIDDFLSMLPSTVKRLKRPLKVQGVVQGNTVADWWRTFRYIQDNSYIDVIGLSRKNPVGFVPPTTNLGISRYQHEEKVRWWLLNKILNWAAERNNTRIKPIHLLGLADMRALRYYSCISVIRSIDTSFPYMAAETGFKLELDTPKPEGLVNYGAQPDDVTIALTTSNLHTMARYCHADLTADIHLPDEWVHDYDS